MCCVCKLDFWLRQLTWKQCCHFWCFNTRSDIFRQISDVWCYGDKSDVDWAAVFASHISSPFRMKIVISMIYTFPSSISHAYECVLSLQTEEAPFAAFRITFCVNNNRLLHLMTIFRSVSDSTRVVALC